MIIGESQGQRGQLMPQALRSKELARHRARLALEPVDPGFGRTLGTALGPVLRSSLRASASTIESAHCDRLVLDIETDGSVTPAEALRQGARLLKDQLNAFAAREPGPQAGRDGGARASRTQAHERAGLMRPVDELNLSLRSCTGLKVRNIGLVGDLIQHTETELLRTPHLGRKNLQEIKHSLAAMGLTLGTRVPGWAPPPA